VKKLEETNEELAMKIKSRNMLEHEVKKEGPLAKLYTGKVNQLRDTKARIVQLRKDRDYYENQLSHPYVPSCMVGRERVLFPLEDTLDDLPFRYFEIISAGEDLLGRAEDPKHVGICKASVHFALDTQPPPKPPPLASGTFVVNVYVLRASQLTPCDASGSSDPYIQLTLGSVTKHTRDKYFRNDSNPHFYQTFTFVAQLPEDSRLLLEVLDYDAVPEVKNLTQGRIGDDLVGVTVIDLEDRINSKAWKSKASRDPWSLGPEAKTPIERRPLYVASSSLPQGYIDLWVDILPCDKYAKPLASKYFDAMQSGAKLSNADFGKYKPLDIAAPMDQDWELRVIVWKVRGAPTLNSITSTGLLEMRVRLQFCGREGRFGDGLPRYTDVHARAGGGKGSFNWRFKTDLKLGPFDEADTSPVVLQLNLENCHVFGAPTNLGSGEIDLTQWCQRLYRTARVGWEKKLKEKGRDAPFSPKTQYYRPKDMAFDGKIGGFYDLMDVVMSGELANMAFAEDPEDVDPFKFWVPMAPPRDKPEYAAGKQSNAGEVLVSVEMVPSGRKEELKNGRGRNEPNNHPKLPDPSGRLSFTLNPFSLCLQLLGPKLCLQFCGVIMCFLAVLLIWYMLPVLLADGVEGFFGDIVHAFG